MKRIIGFCITIILSFFLTNLSYSQRTPLPTDSAQWVYQGFAYGNLDSIFIYRVKGDTIIGNITYSKVYRANDNDTNYYSTNETIHCFIRNDSNRRAFIRYPMNYCNDTSDILLYDYSLNIGDTFNVHLFQPRPGYPCVDTIFKFVVTYSVDSAPFNLDYLVKQISLKILNYPQFWCWGNHCSDELDDFLLWNENIGTIYHTTFYNEYAMGACTDILVSYKFWLCGFWEKGNWIKGPCYIPGFYEETQNLMEVEIYPNPVLDKSFIIIKNSTNKMLKYEMYNLLGKKVKSLKLNNEEPEIKIEIKRGDFEPGYYLGNFTDIFGNTSSVKIIIL